LDDVAAPLHESGLNVSTDDDEPDIVTISTSSLHKAAAGVQLGLLCPDVLRTRIRSPRQARRRSWDLLVCVQQHSCWPLTLVQRAQAPPVAGQRTRMPQEPQQLDLAQYPGRVGDVVEHVVDLLDRDLLARLGVDGRADDAVGALADDLLDGVPIGLAVLREELREVTIRRARLPYRDADICHA